MEKKQKLRVDKWLWAVRIFKTRTLATDNCKSGKVRIGSEAIKPSYAVKLGEKLIVKKNGFEFVYEVQDLIEKRVGAPIAIGCYKDLTPPEELLKFESWFLAGKKSEFRDKGIGRPTKKERRAIDDFKEKD